MLSSRPRRGMALLSTAVAMRAALSLLTIVTLRRRPPPTASRRGTTPPTTSPAPTAGNGAPPPAADGPGDAGRGTAEALEARLRARGYSALFLEPAGDAGRGHQAAVRGHRVGTEHQEIVGAIHVGDRQQELVAVHQPVHQLARPLVHRRRAEDVLRAQAAEQGGQVGDVAEMVDVGVAQVGADRVGAI